VDVINSESTWVFLGLVQKKIKMKVADKSFKNSEVETI
jgi:hypothetical protein